MPVQSFNHFNLRADAALTRSLRDFYVDIVGMSEGWRPPFPFPGHWLYLGEQAVLHLVEDPSAGLMPGGRNSAFDHIAFTCTGATALEERLQGAGIEYRRTSVPGTHQLQLFVSDPAGNGVEFNFASGDT